MKRSTSNDAMTATATPAHSAMSQAQPPANLTYPLVINPHATIPVSMNKVGIVKFRKLRTPIVSVKATATVM